MALCQRALGTHVAELCNQGDPSIAAPIADQKTSPAWRSTLSSVFFGSDGLRAGWALLIYLALFFALSSATSLVIKQIHSHLHHAQSEARSPLKPSTVLVGEGLLAAVAMLSTWIMAKIERKPFQAYGLAPADWLPRLLAGLAWGFGFLSLLVFALRSMGLLVFNGKLLSRNDAIGYGALWFASFLAVGFFEETFFRGYMQATLARGFSGVYGWFGAPNRQALGFWSSAVLLSFGFGFTHKSNAGESPVGLLSVGLVGVVFCLSLWRTGSLWWAIGLHAAWDWAQSFLYGVADSGTVVAGRLFATHPVGRPILSGGLTGPEGSIFIVPVILLMVIVIVVTLPRRAASVPCETPPIVELH